MPLSVIKFISTSKLDEYFRGEVLQLLESNGIYDLGAFGWLDEETPDPENIGHTRWQTEPPLNFSDSSNSGILSLDLTRLASQPWLEQIAIAGTDFEGLMAAARLNIGLLLFYGNIAAGRAFSDKSYFDVYRMSAIIYLSMAADRIRDVFVLSVFHKSAKKYEGGDPARRSYKFPFENPAVPTTNPTEFLQRSLQQLPKLSEKVAGFRKERNRLVHEVATALGKLERNVIATSKEAAKEVSLEDYIDFLRNHDEQAERLREVEGVLKVPVDWYQALVELSNHVFVVENQMRRDNVAP